VTFIPVALNNATRPNAPMRPVFLATIALVAPMSESFFLGVGSVLDCVSPQRWCLHNARCLCGRGSSL
jgi:hypothetical protein